MLGKVRYTTSETRRLTCRTLYNENVVTLDAYDTLIFLEDEKPTLLFVTPYIQYEQEMDININGFKYKYYYHIADSFEHRFYFNEKGVEEYRPYKYDFEHLRKMRGKSGWYLVQKNPRRDTKIY